MAENNESNTGLFIGMTVAALAIIAFFAYSFDGVKWKKAKPPPSRDRVMALKNATPEERIEYSIEVSVANLGSADTATIEQAVWALEQQGTKAVPIISEQLVRNSDDEAFKANALYAMGRLGKNAASGVPVLEAYLRDENADARATAARALGKIGRGAGSAVPSLAQLLNDESSWVRNSARVALESINTSEARYVLKYGTSAGREASSGE